MTINSDSALYKMREVEKSYSLRSSFIYQNLMYLAAGKVIETLSNQTWGAFLKERIFQPLGMNDTYSLLEQVQSIENKADAHYEIDGKITKMEIKTKKNGVGFNIDAAVLNKGGGLVTMLFSVSSVGSARVDMSGSFGERISFQGNIVGLNKSTVYKATPIF